MFLIAVLCLLPLAPVQAASKPVDVASNVNTANHGLAVAKGDYIYYIDQLGDVYAGCSERIFKVKKSGGGREVLSIDEAWDLSTDGEWLYYSNWSDNHRIYRINSDGEEKKAISDDAASQLAFVGDGLLYIKWSSSGVKGNLIYKISLDGQTKKALSTSPADNLNVVGEWVYFSNIADDYKLYRVSVKGGSKQIKISEQSMLFMVVSQDYIYYSNASDKGKLYKMKIDGTQNAKITDDTVGFINKMGEWIYYTNSADGDTLYKVKADGSGRRKVRDFSATAMPINIVDGKVYYDGQFL